MSGRDENWAVTQLIKAEQEANQIIKAAESERQRSLNLAKEQAQQQVNEFKQDEEIKYQAAIQKNFPQNEDDGQLEQQTEQEIQKITDLYNQNKPKVIKTLMDQFLDVNIEISDTVRDTIVANYKKK